MTFQRVLANSRDRNLEKLAEKAICACQLATVSVGVSRQLCDRVNEAAVARLLVLGAAVASGPANHPGGPVLFTLRPSGRRLQVRLLSMAVEARQIVENQIRQMRLSRGAHQN